MNKEKELIEKFEIYITENHEYGIWKDYIEIEEITGVDIHDIIKIIGTSNKFKQNSRGKFSTEKMYLKYTGFWRQVSDMIGNRIY